MTLLSATVAYCATSACTRQDCCISLSTAKLHVLITRSCVLAAGRSVDPVSVHATRTASLVCHAYGQPGSYDNNPYHPASQQSQFSGSNMMGRQNSSAVATMDNGNTALKTKDQPKTVQVRFWLKFHVDYGQSIRLIGGHEQAGE